MRRILSAITLIGMCLACPCFAQDAQNALDGAALRLLPPDARFAMGIQWRRALGSSVRELIDKQLRESPLPRIPGFPAVEKTLLEDLDSILISSSAIEPPPDGRDTPMLAIVKGRFDPAEVRKWMKGTTQRYRNFDLITPTGVKPPTTRTAVLDANTILFGDRKELTAAIDRFAGPTAAKPRSPILARAAALDAEYDLWILLVAPPGGFKAKGNPSAAMFADVSGFELGMRFSDGLRAQATVRAKSQQAAQSLGTMIQGGLAMAAASNDMTPEGAEALKKIQVTPEPSGVTIQVSLTRDDLTRLQAASARKTATPTATTPKRSTPGKIRITGMDSGPVELPVSPPK